MPDIPAFPLADFKFPADIFRNVRRAFIQASESDTCFPARFVVRIAGNDRGGFTAQPDFPANQSAGTVRKMSAAVRRVDMVPDMALVVNAPAFAVPVADLADLAPVVVQGDLPDLFMAETQFPVRCAYVQRNKVDHAIRIFRSVMSEKHGYLTLPEF